MAQTPGPTTRPVRTATALATAAAATAAESSDTSLTDLLAALTAAAELAGNTPGALIIIDPGLPDIRPLALTRPLKGADIPPDHHQRDRAGSTCQPVRREDNR